MANNAMKRLEYLCEIIPPLLSSINETDLSYKPSPSQWSKKDILGHLIDSASNNHQRFVRIQFEDTPYIVYDPDKWNAYSYYNFLNGSSLISFWTLYNKHLAALVSHIPTEHYQRNCQVGEQTFVTLEFLITDYADHLEHHLKQLVNYE